MDDAAYLLDEPFPSDHYNTSFGHEYWQARMEGSPRTDGLPTKFSFPGHPDQVIRSTQATSKKRSTHSARDEAAVHP